MDQNTRLWLSSVGAVSHSSPAGARMAAVVAWERLDRRRSRAPEVAAACARVLWGAFFCCADEHHLRASGRRVPPHSRRARAARAMQAGAPPGMDLASLDSLAAVFAALSVDGGGGEAAGLEDAAAEGVPVVGAATGFAFTFGAGQAARGAPAAPAHSRGGGAHGEGASLRARSRKGASPRRMLLLHGADVTAPAAAPAEEAPLAPCCAATRAQQADEASRRAAALGMAAGCAVLEWAAAAEEEVWQSDARAGVLSLALQALDVPGGWDELVALGAVRAALSFGDEAVARVAVDAGLAMRLVCYTEMRRDCPQMVTEAAVALQHLTESLNNQAYGPSSEAVFSSGGVSAMMRLLRSPEQAVRARSAAAAVLGDLGHRMHFAVAVLEADTLPALLEFLADARIQPSEKCDATRALSRLYYWGGRDFEHSKTLITASALPTVARLLQTDDSSLLEAASEVVCHSWAWEHALFGPLDATLQRSVCDRLGELCAHSNNLTALAATQALANVAAERGEGSQAALVALPPLRTLLGCSSGIDEDVQQEACVVLRNLAWKGPERVRALIDAGMIQSLGELFMAVSDNLGLKQEAAWAIAVAAVHATPGQLDEILSEQDDVLGTLCSVLDSFAEFDADMMVDVLLALESILDAGDAGGEEELNLYEVCVEELGGVDALVELATSTDEPQVVEIASAILESHFPDALAENAYPE